MKKRVVKIILCLFLLNAGEANLCAQEWSRRFDDGCKYYDKGQYENSKNAFISSKDLNKSPDHVKKCDYWISKCDDAKKTSPKPNSPEKREKSVKTEYELYVNYSEVQVAACPTMRSVIQIERRPDGWNQWEYKIENMSHSEDNWLNIERGKDAEATFLYITCKNNTRNTARTATVVVTASPSLKKAIKISQKAGRSVWFYVDGDTYYEVKRKPKNSIVVKISSNSLIEYPENKNRNWRVVNMPRWCKGTDLKRTSKGNVPVEPNELAIDVEANAEERVREGDIKIESQGLYQIIHIKQKK